MIAKVRNRSNYARYHASIMFPLYAAVIPRNSHNLRPPPGVFPCITYMGICRYAGYGFQAVKIRQFWSRIGKKMIIV